MLGRHKLFLLRYPDQSCLELPWLSNWIFPFSKPMLQTLAISSYASTFSSVLRHFFQHTRWPSKGHKKLCWRKLHFQVCSPVASSTRTRTLATSSTLHIFSANWKYRKGNTEDPLAEKCLVFRVFCTAKLSSSLSVETTWAKWNFKATYVIQPENLLANWSCASLKALERCRSVEVVVTQIFPVRKVACCWIIHNLHLLVYKSSLF